MVVPIVKSSLKEIGLIIQRQLTTLPPPRTKTQARLSLEFNSDKIKKDQKVPNFNIFKTLQDIWH